MEMRQRIALNFPPVLLRLLLATAFIWAGLGKIAAHMEVSGERAAILANMGVIAPPQAAAPEGQPAAAPAAPRTYTAADFPEPARVLRLYGLALTLHAAANPAPTETNGQPMRLWPYGLGQGKWPVYQAYAVAFTELIAGVCMFIGLLTRFWAFALATIMLGALWLTEIGPAIQTGATVLGFLPDRPAFAPDQWQRLMYQFSLFMVSLAVVFLGAGRASLDHVLFGPARDEDDED